MRYAIAMISLLITAFAFGQHTDDKNVLIKISDTSALYQRVKTALVKNDFIVKDDGNLDTLVTYPREFKMMPGYSIVKAKIIGNTVVLSGVYGMKKINDFGYTDQPKSYKPIVYFKGSKAWQLLLQIADLLNGEISYSK